MMARQDWSKVWFELIRGAALIATFALLTYCAGRH
jgi:hypothetical protein